MRIMKSNVSGLPQVFVELHAQAVRDQVLLYCNAAFLPRRLAGPFNKCLPMPRKLQPR